MTNDSPNDSAGPERTSDGGDSSRYLPDGESSGAHSSAQKSRPSGCWQRQVDLIADTQSAFNWSSSDLAKRVPYFVYFAHRTESFNEVIFKDWQYFMTLFGDLDRQYEEELKNHYFVSIDPLIAAAMGTGLLVWGLHIGNMVATLLTTSAAMSHVDPLVVLDGKRVRDEVENDWDEADKLLHASRPETERN